jgi:hypothetical protein
MGMGRRENNKQTKRFFELALPPPSMHLCLKLKSGNVLRCAKMPKEEEEWHLLLLTAGTG